MGINYKHSGGIDLPGKTMLEVMSNIWKAEHAVRNNGDFYDNGSSKCHSLAQSNNGKCPKGCRSELGCKKVMKLMQLWDRDVFDPALENRILQAKTVEELVAIQLPKNRNECSQ